MQSLTAAPREALTAEEVRDLLVRDDVTISAGLELLTTGNVVASDISDDLDSGSVTHETRALVHGGCSLKIHRALAWGRDRVRPYMILSNAAVEARFNLGVYVLTTPQTKRGESPVAYDVRGYDLLQPLATEGPGDTYVVAPETTCLDAVRTVIEAAIAGAPVLFDGTQQAAVPDGPMVWAIADGVEPTWLDIANDLLDAIGYESLWVDMDGNYRSQPWQDPLVRPVGWTFDVGDESTNLVGPDRTEDADVWSAPNRWKFVRRGMAVQPVDGDGIYMVDNLNRGPSSQASIGKIRRSTVYLDAVDQSSLEAQGDKIVAQDTAVTRTVTLDVDPLPIAGHLDVVQYVDGDVSAKAEVISWQVNLDGSSGRFVLEVTE